MIFLVNLPRFLLRYFPIFILPIILAMISGSGAVFLLKVIYFDVDGVVRPALWVSTLIIIVGNVMIMLGRPQWVWLLAVFFVFCLLLALPPVVYAYNKFLWCFNVFVALLGLLTLYSNRHARMRRKMLQIRHHRSFMG